MGQIKYKKEEWEIICIPKNVKTDVDGFSFLSFLFNSFNDQKNILLDFQQCERLDANLCAALGAFVLLHRKKGVEVKLENYENQSFLKNTFKNNGFLDLFSDVPEIKEANHTVIPFARYGIKNEVEFESYIYNYLLSATKIPEMSEGAKRKIFRSIFELYQNFVMHSHSTELFVCGQYYSKRGTVSLTMVEFGTTFKQKIQQYSPAFASFSAAQCINWAVQSGNTTKSIKDAGGLGLDLIRNFLNLNRGKLQIGSAEGYWQEQKGAIFTKDCDYYFPGSIVNIEFNLKDKNSYTTAEELTILDIL